jgi:4-amino-4-deoxy-L-arabinose transferase-like glycosyltransferase
MSKNPDAQPGKTNAGLRPYWITAAIVVVCYVVFALLLKTDEETVRALMLAGVLLCGAFFAIKTSVSRNRSKTETLIIVLIAAGMVMRIGYMLYTSFMTRGHDIGAFDDDGHFGYMYQLFATGTLPQVNSYQFYHPPFEHIVQALVVKVFSWFQGTGDLTALFESAKIVPCFASCAMLWVARSLCREMALSPRATAIALGVFAFHPAFFILSASVNNDPLMLLFFLIAVLYTIRWYHQPTMKNILVIALSIGLGMMTKLSAGMAALFTAPVFLLVLVQKLREKQAKMLIGQFAAFAGVCVPLGLWYPVRNLILFDQPLSYITGVSSALYIGDVPLAQRFLSFPLDQLINPLYCHAYDDYNVWLYTVKCSMFGEFSFEGLDTFAAILIITNLVLIVVSLAAMVYVLIRGKETDKFARFGLLWIWLTQMGSFILFNLKYPMGCTMDFRYIIPTAIIGAIFTGIALDRVKGKPGVLSRPVYYVGLAAVVLFCAASVLFYAI